jgi:hypothetical protein
MREEHGQRVLENRVLGRYLNLKGKKMDHGENCIINFIACIHHLMLLG